MPFRTTFIAKSPIVYSANPPNDTSVLWYDTVNGVLKFYNKSSGNWEKVVNVTEEILSIVFGVV